MDWNWDAVIERNRSALLRVLLSLLTLARISSRGEGTIPRYLRSFIIKHLQPAESAARRLIVIYALVHALSLPALPEGERAGPAHPIQRGSGKRAPVFRLRDVRKRFDRPPRGRGRRPVPNITLIGWGERYYVEPPVILPDDAMDAAKLLRRMEALRLALMDIPKQAKRFMRFEARRRAAKPGPKCYTALRPGFAPGHRKRHIHPVDEILAECCRLERRASRPPDTS